MRTTTFIASTLALAAPLVSAGNAIVRNKCPQTLYLWSVGPEGVLPGPHSLAPSSTGQPFSEKFIVNGGRALKITSSPNGLYTASPTLHLAYTIDVTPGPEEDLVWYDINTVYGDLIPGNKVTLETSDKTCEGITWADGKYPGPKVGVCGSKGDLVLTLCA